MLKLFLVRHGYDDFEEGSNSMGRSQILGAARFLKERGQRYDFDFRTALFHTSPKSRATNSAEIFSTELNLARAVQESWLDETEEKNSLEKLLELMAKFETHIQRGSIIVITHFPNIECILENLLASWGKPPHNLKISNGSIIWVDFESRILRQIYKP